MFSVFSFFEIAMMGAGFFGLIWLFWRLTNPNLIGDGSGDGGGAGCDDSTG